MSRERYIEKIKKLLALASDPAASPNEAETAGRQAAALMAKYDLELADLTDAELRAEWDLTEDSIVGCRPGKKNPSKVPPWINMMAYGIKIYTRTRCVRSGPYLKFQGPRQDVALAHWMLKALIDLAYSASKGQDNPNAFRNGFGSAIQSRLKAMVKQREEAEAGSRALAVVDKLRIEMDARFGSESQGRTIKTQHSQAGYEAGQRANIPTNRPLTSSSRRLLA